MALDANTRTATRAQWMQENATPVAFNKADLAAAIGAIDDWLDQMQSAFNLALPQPFRTAATLAQKTDLMCFVALRRAGRTRVG